MSSKPWAEWNGAIERNRAAMAPGLCLDSGEFIPAAELNRRINMKTSCIEINNDEVICPNCCHQFLAIPVNVQKRVAELEAQQPLTRDQVLELHEETGLLCSLCTFQNIAAAVEAAHGIGEKP